MNTIQSIISKTNLPKESVRNTLRLLEEDATVPFIARYRKEMTGQLDEVQIDQILKFKKEFEDLEKRKKAIRKSISEQGGLPVELEQKIHSVDNLYLLEDLYLPYKKKRRTKADAARDLGLEPLARIIL